MSLAQEFPHRGRLIGIDYGTVRIGLASCDPDRILSSPLEVYVRKDLAADAKYFQQLIVAERPVGFVVGLPVHMSGDESEKSREARQFAAWLAELSHLPIAFQDERFTSAEADQSLAVGGLKRRKADRRRDMLAAQVILARFLESGGRSSIAPLND